MIVKARCTSSVTAVWSTAVAECLSLAVCVHRTGASFVMALWTTITKYLYACVCWQCRLTDLLSRNPLIDKFIAELGQLDQPNIMFKVC